MRDKEHCFTDFNVIHNNYNFCKYDLEELIN